MPPNSFGSSLLRNIEKTSVAYCVSEIQLIKIINIFSQPHETFKKIISPNIIGDMEWDTTVHQKK